jgi:hypothetical protein
VGKRLKRQDICRHTYWQLTQNNRVCGKAFSHAGTLKNHIRTHTGDKLTKCGILGNTFIQTRHLQQRIRTHTTDKRCRYDMYGNIWWLWSLLLVNKPKRHLYLLKILGVLFCLVYFHVQLNATMVHNVLWIGMYNTYTLRIKYMYVVFSNDFTLTNQNYLLSETMKLSFYHKPSFISKHLRSTTF